MPIKIYNTFTKRKEDFIPQSAQKVGMYTCGATVYDHIHLGNARPLIVFDVIRRYLEFLGYEVVYVVNITDVDDKIINKANQENVTTSTIAERYIEAFFNDIQKLGIRRANHHPRATENIWAMVEMIKTLTDKNHAYVVDGNVYFNIESFPDYGKLSGKSLDELKAGARVEVDPLKKNPLDFVLWKKSKPNEPSWDSHWGKGRPGWHIECSAMSMHYLSDTIDIHAGGHDLIFPHHENEIAQAEAATGKKFVRYWLHNGFLDIRGEKMAKSEGNVLLVCDVLKKYDPVAIRLFFLLKHYRSPIDFSEEHLSEAEIAVKRLQNTYNEISHLGIGEGTRSRISIDDLGSDGERELYLLSRSFIDDFKNTMNDDFNTAGALGHLFSLVKAANNVISKGELTKESEILLRNTRELMLFTGDLFGISYVKKRKEEDDVVKDLMDILINLRKELREEKNYKLSDMIRDELEKCGFNIKDRNDRTTWIKVR